MIPSQSSGWHQNEKSPDHPLAECVCLTHVVPVGFEPTLIKQRYQMIESQRVKVSLEGFSITNGLEFKGLGSIRGFLASDFMVKLLVLFTFIL